MQEKICVEITTIDNFLADHNNQEVNFIKMDIEGAESEALKGMSQTIKNSNYLNMVVEFNPIAMGYGSTRSQEFFAILSSLDLRTRVIEEFSDGSSNLLCQKNNR